ncbi:MAG: polyphosphate kinase 2 family protein [Bacteroidota bacterium]
MGKLIDLSTFTFSGQKKLALPDLPTRIPLLYDSKKAYKDLLETYQESIHDYQNIMYAHNRYSLLLVFQAMDAAGKDGTIRNVLSGVNPHGLQIFAFKKPSTKELDHDFLWRTTVCFPERGRIGVFNRSYYEEVLVVKVHPEILTKYQLIPKEEIQDINKVWVQRYQAITNLEKYAYQNGTRVIKFFLNVSKEEQKNRFLKRLRTPAKNWKFSESDIEERQYWDDYMDAYTDCINETATEWAPWYVIPADDKRNMRLMVAQVIEEHLAGLDMNYPVIDEKKKANFQMYEDMLMKD